LESLDNLESRKNFRKEQYEKAMRENNNLADVKQMIENFSKNQEMIRDVTENEKLA
jgi:hypothetical protein